MVEIEVDEISKSYQLRDGSSLPVIDSVDFQVEEGEFVSILGPSGCGKSTLLSILAGMTERDAGDITINHRDGMDSRIGFVFQDPTLLNWKTVANNIRFALEGMEVPKAEQDDCIHDALEIVGLLDFEDEYPQSLSGGMQQRVGIARALSVDPDVLMMDEPFGSLDEITARNLRSDLLDIWAQTRKTILFVTHNVREAAFLSDRIIILSNKPASIQEIVEVDIPRPREQDDPRIMDYESRILSILGIEP